MKGCAAAIILISFSTDRQRVPPAARAGAIEHGVVLWFQMGCALDGHGAADVTVGSVDLSTGKAKRGQKIKFRVLKGFSRNLRDWVRNSAPSVHLLKTNLMSKAPAPALDFVDLRLAKSFVAEAFVIDVGRAQ